MATSRRDFLKLSGHVATGTLLIYTAKGLVTGENETPNAKAEGEEAYADYDPKAHEWVFVVDTIKCIGCGRCARACKIENNVPWDKNANRTWIERYQFHEDEFITVDSPDGGVNGFRDEIGLPLFSTGRPATSAKPVSEAEHSQETVVKSFFVPKLCNQCKKPPCVQVCPVGATYQTVDGVTLVNQKKCIGCRYCIQACPYGARYLLPAGDRTPTGQAHVVDKCTWCYHRITRGLKPACVEACPVDARLFGDMADLEDPVGLLVKQNRMNVLKPDLGTQPMVKYIALDEAVV